MMILQMHFENNEVKHKMAISISSNMRFFKTRQKSDIINEVENVC